MKKSLRDSISSLALLSFAFTSSMIGAKETVTETQPRALAIEVDTSLPAERVIRVLDQLKERRGLPKQIRVDNGSSRDRDNVWH